MLSGRWESAILRVRCCCSVLFITAPLMIYQFHPYSKNQSSKITRDSQNHYFRKDQQEVIAWRRHNGFLRVTVESVKWVSLRVSATPVCLKRLCWLVDSLLRDLDPFLSAVWNGDAEALSALIHTKPRNLSEANQEGWIPLHESAYYGHVDCLKLLLNGKESSINIPSWTLQCDDVDPWHISIVWCF